MFYISDALMIYESTDGQLLAELHRILARDAQELLPFAGGTLVGQVVFELADAGADVEEHLSVRCCRVKPGLLQ